MVGGWLVGLHERAWWLVPLAKLALCLNFLSLVFLCTHTHTAPSLFARAVCVVLLQFAWLTSNLTCSTFAY